jgi:predicted translin family RNA/ssDNA-binding protein
MLNKKEFAQIRRELSNYDLSREELIKKGRDVLKLSKQLIYSIHRSNSKEINELMKNIVKKKKELDRISLKNKNLICEASYSDAIQEYVEALCYYYLIKDKRIPTRKELSVNTEDYLLGICDLTGELVRKAVSLTVKRDFNKVALIKDFVEEIYGEFLKFNLRNGQLRKKSDSIKWNLKKLEEIMYDINTKK